MLLFCHRSNFLTIFFFYQLCCPPAKATVILETATSSLVSSPLLLTTNPALRVVSCPHAYFLTRRIPVFFFFFYCFEEDFSVFPDFRHWNGRSLLHLRPPRASSSSALLCLSSPPSFEPFFLHLLLFLDSEPSFSIFPDLDVQVLFFGQQANQTARLQNLCFWSPCFHSYVH